MKRLPAIKSIPFNTKQLAGFIILSGFKIYQVAFFVLQLTYQIKWCATYIVQSKKKIWGIQQEFILLFVSCHFLDS